jgi:glycerol-3-phosphate dehydrogenase (NAD(P)+)
VIAILGAGAMGVALASHLARGGHDTTVLATEFDGAVAAAWHRGLPHPALGVVPSSDITLVGPNGWSSVLPAADIVVVAVSSQGLASVITAAAPHARADAIWMLATKGWQGDTLRSPSEVAASVLGPSALVVALSGPGIAAEILTGAPTALLCAARNARARRTVADVLRSPTMLTVTTSDVAGAETASAYKNVVGIAVGIAEGLSERFMERAYVRTFANARAAMFAQGMMDMVHLAEVRGGRAATVIGLAGSGDLYVTSNHGRNGHFGRLLGSGATPDQAMRSIGSTVEGVANTEAALRLADRYGIDLPTARVVDMALQQQLTQEDAMEQMLSLFATALPIVARQLAMRLGSGQQRVEGGEAVAGLAKLGDDDRG